MANLYSRLSRLDQDRIVRVEVNDVRMAVWPPNQTTQFLVTANLNACTAIAIISPTAGILAHIPPLPTNISEETLRENPNIGMWNVHRLVASLHNIYTANIAHFRDSRTFVVAGIFRQEPAMADAIRHINTYLQNLSLPVTWRSYPVVETGNRPEGFTSVVIWAETEGEMPAVFINDARQ